jgi:EpsI family protein
MISYDNRIIDQTRWSVLHESRRIIDLSSKTFPVIELIAGSGDQRRYVWLFYWVDGAFTADPLVAKTLEVKAKLFSGDQRAATVAVATSEATNGNADVALRSFLQEAFAPIEAFLKGSMLPASMSLVEH